MIKNDLVTAIDLLGIVFDSNLGEKKKESKHVEDMKILEPSSFIDFAMLMALYYL